MKSRHHAREIALQILYRIDIAGASGTLAPVPVASRTPAQWLAEFSTHFDHFQVTPAVREFAAQLVAGTVSQLPEIDALLESQAAHWKVARMGLVDRNLLRLAIYELVYFRETPASVVINEAIELGKAFGTAETPAFVNGVLDGIRQGHEGSERSVS